MIYMSGGGGGRVLETQYLFIDGAYLRRMYEERMKAFFGSADFNDLDFTILKTHCASQKAFYYDCIDDIKKTGNSGFVVGRNRDRGALWKLPHLWKSAQNADFSTGAWKRPSQKTARVVFSTVTTVPTATKHNGKPVWTGIR
jgi:hypothetical protein